MLRRALLALFTLLLFAAPAFAQGTTGCGIAVYADADGSGQFVSAGELVLVEMYVVLFVEDAVKAVSYSIDIQTDFMEYFWISDAYGPEYTGINIASPGGYNVGLGVCVPGFLQSPVLVARHTIMTLNAYKKDSAAKSPYEIARVYVAPNVDENPDFPVYASCDNRIEPCDPGMPLSIMSGGVPVASESIGRIKALY